jgi:hypothetical protein
MYSQLFRIGSLSLLVGLGLSWLAVHGQSASTSNNISVCFTKARPDTTVPYKGEARIEVNHADNVFIVLEIPPGMAKSVFKIQWCARPGPQLPCRDRDSLEYDYEPPSGEKPQPGVGGNAKWKRVISWPPNFKEAGKSWITVSLNDEIVGLSEPIQIE